VQLREPLLCETKLDTRERPPQLCCVENARPSRVQGHGTLLEGRRLLLQHGHSAHQEMFRECVAFGMQRAQEACIIAACTLRRKGPKQPGNIRLRQHARANAIKHSLQLLQVQYTCAL